MPPVTPWPLSTYYLHARTGRGLLLSRPGIGRGHLPRQEIRSAHERPSPTS